MTLRPQHSMLHFHGGSNDVHIGVKPQHKISYLTIDSRGLGR